MITTNPLPITANYATPEVDDIANNPKKLELRNACQEFEAVMTTLIMKEGLKSAQQMGKLTGNDEENDKGCVMYEEIANEQIANYIGKQGLLGIADMIYNQVSDRLDKIKPSDLPAAAAATAATTEPQAKPENRVSSEDLMADMLSARR